jgi:tetratricopeptide (TPR) repeat protein
VQARPAESKRVIGERWLAYPHIDYFLQPPPPQLKIDSKTSEVIKLALNMIHEPPKELFSEALESNNPTSALNFAEGQLQLSPNQGDLADLYVAAAIPLNQVERTQTFLKKRIAARPVSINIHRAYQNLQSLTNKGQNLETEYAQLLQNEPNNAALMYLKGRVTSDQNAQRDLFTKSTRTDPTLGWGWYALAYDDASRGEWPSCLAMMSHIPKGPQLTSEVDELLKLARLATGHADIVEAEARRKVASNAGTESFQGLFELLDALMTQGKSDQARAAYAKWESQLPPAVRSSADIAPLRSAVSYFLGDFTTIKNQDKTSKAPSPTSSSVDLHTLMVTGEHDSVVKRPEILKLLNENLDPQALMGLSVAYQLIGNHAEAQSWRERAATSFEGFGREGSRRAAALLRARQPPPFDEVKAIVLRPRVKCLFVTLLALRFPQQKELAKLAKTLNVSRAPDYYLVEKALK